MKACHSLALEFRELACVAVDEVLAGTDGAARCFIAFD